MQLNWYLYNAIYAEVLLYHYDVSDQLSWTRLLTDKKPSRFLILMAFIGLLLI